MLEALPDSRKFLSKLRSTDDKTLALYMVGLTNPEMKDDYDQVADKIFHQNGKISLRFLLFVVTSNSAVCRFLHKIMMKYLSPWQKETFGAADRRGSTVH